VAAPKGHGTDVADHWTEARMQAAEPRDLRVDRRGLGSREHDPDGDRARSGAVLLLGRRGGGRGREQRQGGDRGCLGEAAHGEEKYAPNRRHEHPLGGFPHFPARRTVA
jgi:hypothetical protein